MSQAHSAEPAAIVNGLTMEGDVPWHVALNRQIDIVSLDPEPGEQENPIDLDAEEGDEGNPIVL
ncbi:hypothetical protein BDV09DRAFT_200126 [Aspergillus tetrazonus]